MHTLLVLHESAREGYRAVLRGNFHVLQLWSKHAGPWLGRVRGDSQRTLDLPCPPGQLHEGLLGHAVNLVHLSREALQWRAPVRAAGADAPPHWTRASDGGALGLRELALFPIFGAKLAFRTNDGMHAYVRRTDWPGGAVSIEGEAAVGGGRERGGAAPVPNAGWLTLAGVPWAEREAAPLDPGLVEALRAPERRAELQRNLDEASRAAEEAATAATARAEEEAMHGREVLRLGDALQAAEEAARTAQQAVQQYEKV
jgi:hypothetical protein